MLSVILNGILLILKIIGILLLILLLLILLLLMAVLFDPVRYKASGDFGQDYDQNVYHIKAKLSWLLHIVSIDYSLNNDISIFKFKLFGIDPSSIFKWKSSKKKSRKRKSSKKNTSSRKKKISGNDILKANNDKKNRDNSKSEKLDITNSIKEKKIEAVQQDEKSLDTLSADKQEKKSIFSKIVSIKDNAKSIFSKLQNIGDKLKNFNQVKDSFIEYLTSDNSKQQIKEIKDIIVKILKHIFPRKFKAYVKFGFEDPATTGNVLAIASILYGIYGENIVLDPDFEHKVMETEFDFKGKIRVITLIIATWKLFRNKWIKEFLDFSKKSMDDL